MREYYNGLYAKRNKALYEFHSHRDVNADKAVILVVNTRVEVFFIFLDGKSKTEKEVL